MAMFRDKVVPIPKVKGITINRADGNRVLFVKEAPYDAKVGYARPKRTTIGYVNDKDVKTMHPTTGYKQIFPSEWEKLFGEKVPVAFKRIGMYAMAESVNMKTGIKDVMNECFGSSHADAIMDFALYSMLYQTSVAEHITTRMKDQMLYSGECRSDSFYSDLYSNGITYEQILSFKSKWANLCKKDGVEEVWLCIDGSNDDCQSVGVELAEKGHAKSKRNRNIVSFTYAVTEAGKPVTFDLYRGGLVDAKAMKRIISFLKENGIQVKGVILDRGYCDSTALRYLNNEHLTYIIMVKSNPAGYKDMIDAYGNMIKLNAEYLIPGTCLFGIQQKVQLFDNYKHEDYLTLFYDYKNGGERITALLKKLYAEIERCEAALAKGEQVQFATKFKEMLKVSDDGKHVDIVLEVLQKAIDEKGLYSIVASLEMSPPRVHSVYQCRNSSETEYMIVKSQLGYGTVRVQETRSVQAKFATAFIASCIRYELQVAAKEINRTTNEVIQEMNQLYMTKVGASYVPIQGITGRQELILKTLESSVGLLSEIASEENTIIAGKKPTPRHRKTGPNNKPTVSSAETEKPKPKTSKTTPKKKTGAKGKPGVKPGTKRPDKNMDGSERKKPGVPLGTKRGPYNKDGSSRKKPGPKTATVRTGATTSQA